MGERDELAAHEGRAVTAAELVRTRLLALSAVTALVGQRVRTMVLAENETYPAIRVQRVSEVEPMHMRGSVGALRSRVQVDTYATTYASARSIDAAVHGDGSGSGLGGFSGDIGSTHVDLIRSMNAVDGYEGDQPDRLVRIMREYEVQYRAA